MKYTKELYDEIPKHTTFAVGTCFDDPSGINMTKSGNLLLWVARKGEINDFSVYTHYLEKGIEWILKSGDKVCSTTNLTNILDCDDDVWCHYRY